MTKRRSLRSKISDMQDILLSNRSLITDNLSIGLKKPSARAGENEPTASSLVGGGTKSKEDFNIIFCNESQEVHTGEKNKKNRRVSMQINGIP
ncbi:hypothetical protein Bca4012_079362 [Brassica carinata]